MDDITFTGLDKLAKLLSVGGQAATRATGRALRSEANAAFNESQRQVPVATGALRASGEVDGPNYLGNSELEVTIGYGGAAGPYALIVHENLEAHHPVGKAKYLEDPVNEQIDGMAERIASRVDKALQEGM